MTSRNLPGRSLGLRAFTKTSRADYSRQFPKNTRTIARSGGRSKGGIQVEPHTLITEALEMMSREDVNQLPVVLDGSVAGIISRGDVLRLLQTRAELQTIRSG